MTSVPESANPVAPASPAAPAAADCGPLTAEQLAEARQYGRLELICGLADKLLDLVYLAVMAFLVARPLDAYLQRSALLAGNDSLRLAALLLITLLVHLGVSLPLSYYSGHVLEHRFGLSNQDFRQWLWRYAKRNALAIGFSLAMFLGLYWIIWLSGGVWWLVAAAAFFLVSVVLGQLAPIVILPLLYQIERLDADELSERLVRLTRGTGLSIEGVYRMKLSAETVKANAMLAGLGRTRRVILGDTLLAEFSLDEIQVIFAHEIGHHVYHHIPKMMLTGGLYSVLGFWICDRILVGYTGLVDYTTLGVHTLPLLMFALTLLSVLLEPLHNTISRRYERQCDRYALAQTGLRDAYVSAFHKLARLNKDHPSPHPLEVLLFHSHPPIAQRLALAESDARL
ncbi:MAG: hypothetical protein A2W31_09940 [Planctomycetes bacterium RBG_16_64_10]|nr:MAG: hypothetical protein A2W31_09940 [Planctomycetes bacterium RBG_16_64_10]